MLRLGIHNSLRKLSTRPSPSTAATSLINLFPGKSLVQKTSSVLVASSVAALAISKEIYIVDHEFFEMICIFGAYYVWYRGFGQVFADYLFERREAIRKVLYDARADHKAVVAERIAHIGKMSDTVSVTQGLFAMSKELAKMEAEAYELKQKATFSHEIKSTLDSWVRYETQVREKQQQQLVAEVIQKVNAALQNPRMYNDVMQQTLVDVEGALKKA